MIIIYSIILQNYFVSVVNYFIFKWCQILNNNLKKSSDYKCFEVRRRIKD